MVAVVVVLRLSPGAVLGRACRVPEHPWAPAFGDDANSAATARSILSRTLPAVGTVETDRDEVWADEHVGDVVELGEQPRDAWIVGFAADSYQRLGRRGWAA